MQIWPAIDLRGGKCVRLIQGDYSRETVFADDPAETARRWVAEGAERLHVVDLDGARSGEPQHVDALRSIVSAVRVPCQVGGGIRSERAIAGLLELGVARVVVGTAALRKPEWFAQMCRSYPGRIALGLDARGGRVATDGWTETASQQALDVVRGFCDLPLAAVIFTDIETDGMLVGPNVDAIARLRGVLSCEIVASGGVSNADDIRHLAEAGADGCIIGMAIYTGRLTLADAMRAGGERSQDSAASAADGRRHEEGPERSGASPVRDR